MDTNHYKVRPGEQTDTLAARALGARSSKDLDTLFRPYVSVGRNQETVWAYQDSRNPDRIAAVATSTERDFYSNTTERATVSVMSRKEWEAAYDRAEESTRPAHAAGDAHFVSALMREVGAENPGRGNGYFAEPAEDFQPRAPGRIKAAAAAAQAKSTAPKPRTHQGDER